MTRWRVAVLVALPALTLVVGTNVVAFFSDVTVAQLTQDPAALAGYPFYFGLFSHVGVLLWAACGTIGIFAWAELRDADPHRARYFLFGGLLSTMFAFDDLLLLHEDVLPFRVGIDEMVVMGVYGALLLTFLVRHYARIIVEGPALLVTAVACFGATVLLDLWDPSGLDVVVEDGLKLLGIGCWLGHFVRAAARSLSPRPT